LQYFPEGSTPVLKLVSTALPALQSVELDSMLIAHADLGSLAACTQLLRLNLCYCQLQQSEADSTTSPLSALHSLRQLSLWYTDRSLAAGLTQLTGLRLGSKRQTVAECLEHITDLTQLQDLKLEDPWPFPREGVSAEEVTSILTSLKQLTSLALHYTIQQSEFDALLTHGSQLTSLTCRRLDLSEDRSASPCSCTELVIEHQRFNAETLAYIPTASLTRLAFKGTVFPSSCPALRFFNLPGMWDADNEPRPGHLPDIVHRCLMNLMRSPAWQRCGPAVNISLEFLQVDNGLPELLSLVLPLAPLASKEVKLSIDMPDAAVGAPEVQQLGVTLGSSLKQLWLVECELSDGFWPAVWADLPGLQQLGVGVNVHGASGAQELAFFCSRATRALQLHLYPDLYKQVGAEGKLDQEGRWRGVPQVTVTQAAGI
jgi:hypothetical protein